MKRKIILSVAFIISLLPMFLNQYGGLKGVQEITGLINLLNPIGMVSVILFAVGVWFPFKKQVFGTNLGALGTIGIVVSEVYEDGVPYDLKLKVADDRHSGLSAIENLMIDSDKGKVPLSTVAEVRSSSTFNSISRENARRRIIVSANVENRDLVGAVEAVKDKINESVKLPKGYYINYGGQFESEKTASRILGIATVFALLLVLLLLYQEFHRVSDALIILVNIPLAMIGGVLILWIGGKEVNIPAIIGFISLLGIATRNGMLLISHYRQLETDGIPLMDRIFIGSRDRLLPIIMTAMSSALALIPIVARGAEPGNEIQSPMALVILGGLLSSTLLNIFVVPILYYVNNKKKTSSHQV